MEEGQPLARRVRNCVVGAFAFRLGQINLELVIQTDDGEEATFLLPRDVAGCLASGLSQAEQIAGFQGNRDQRRTPADP